jgi:hypothetical protein
MLYLQEILLLTLYNMGAIYGHGPNSDTTEVSEEHIATIFRFEE